MMPRFAGLKKVLLDVEVEVLVFPVEGDVAQGTIMGWTDVGLFLRRGEGLEDFYPWQGVKLVRLKSATPEPTPEPVKKSHRPKRSQEKSST